MDNLVDGGYVDVLFTCGECGFSSFGNWSCSEEKVRRGGGSKFSLPPPEAGDSEKLKKEGWTMVQGQVFLKAVGGWHFSYLTFSRFIIFTFRNYFTL